MHTFLGKHPPSSPLRESETKRRSSVSRSLVDSTCPLCKQDLSHIRSNFFRQRHVDQCSNAEQLRVASIEKICPLCFSPVETSLSSHIVNCLVLLRKSRLTDLRRCPFCLAHDDAFDLQDRERHLIECSSRHDVLHCSKMTIAKPTSPLRSNIIDLSSSPLESHMRHSSPPSSPYSIVDLTEPTLVHHNDELPPEILNQSDPIPYHENILEINQDSMQATITLLSDDIESLSATSPPYITAPEDTLTTTSPVLSEPDDRDLPVTEIVITRQNMPDYDALTLPELKSALQKYGFKPGRRAAMVSTLQAIWQQSQQHMTQAADSPSADASNEETGQTSTTMSSKDHIIKHLKSNKELWERILRYESVDIDQCFLGLSCKKRELRELLDEYALLNKPQRSSQR